MAARDEKNPAIAESSPAARRFVERWEAGDRKVSITGAELCPAQRAEIRAWLMARFDACARGSRRNR